MEYSPAAKLQVNVNDFSSLRWMLKSARHSGSVRIELQAVDEAQTEEPWRAHLLLVDGEVASCYLYRKADGQRVLADNMAVLWLHSLGQRKLLWHLESSSTPRQARLSNPPTLAGLSPSPSPAPTGPIGPQATTDPLPDPRPAPPFQARPRGTTNPLSAPRLLPNLPNRSHGGTEPLSEPGLPGDIQAQMEPRPTSNQPAAHHLPPSPQASLRPIMDQLSDPGFPRTHQTGPRPTIHSPSEQYLTGSLSSAAPRSVTPQPSTSTPGNLAPPTIAQIPYRIAPTGQDTSAWSRKHRRVFALIDGTKSVAQIADMLGLPPVMVEQVVADLLSWGTIVCI